MKTGGRYKSIFLEQHYGQNTNSTLPERHNADAVTEIQTVTSGCINTNNAHLINQRSIRI